MEKASYAVLPAAGHSRRMRGPSKLLLPWKHHTVIDEVLQAWTRSNVLAVVLVARRDDRKLHQAVRRWPTVELLVPDDDPQEMKHSIRLGLHFLRATRNPGAADRWLMAPSDLPTLCQEVIDRVIEAGQASDQIVAPRFGGRSGHPVSLPWSIVPAVDRLPPDQGINHIIHAQPVTWVDLPPEWFPDDIDTPEQYRRLS
jgi:molybdenum cofactor cytidylyltransferase